MIMQSDMHGNVPQNTVFEKGHFDYPDCKIHKNGGMVACTKNVDKSGWFCKLCFNENHDLQMI